MHDDDATDPRIERARRHPAREAILAVLTERGGLTLCQVREHLPDEPRPSTVGYHLRVLLGAGLVSATDDPDAPSGTIGEVWALA